MIVGYLCSSLVHGALLNLLRVFNGKLERCDRALIYSFIVLLELFFFISNKNAVINVVKERTLV